MSKHFFTSHTFWHLSFVAMLLLILSSLLVACKSVTPTPADHAPTIQGKLSLLHVPEPYVLPGKIILGPDSNLWFPAIAYRNFGTNQPSGAIGRLAPDGTFHMFSMPTPNSYPTQIIIGPDNNLWFTVVQGNGQVNHGLDTQPRFSGAYSEIGKMTLDGKFNVFPLPSAEAKITGIAAGPDGNVWFTEVTYTNNSTVANNINKIGHLTPSGTFIELALPTLDESDTVGSLITGSDGNLWFVIEGIKPDYSTFGKMGRMTPQGTLKVFSLGQFAVPGDLTIGPDHNLWFTTGISIGRLTSDGQLKTFTPSGNANNRIAVGGITTSTDGALWFATANVAVGRVTTDGTFKFYPFPDNTYFDNGGSSLTLGELKGIASGADGTLWLTDDAQIGHVV
jgi:virginiamycin B lyase